MQKAINIVLLLFCLGSTSFLEAKRGRREVSEGKKTEQGDAKRPEKEARREKPRSNVSFNFGLGFAAPACRYGPCWRCCDDYDDVAVGFGFGPFGIFSSHSPRGCGHCGRWGHRGFFGRHW